MKTLEQLSKHQKIACGYELDTRNKKNAIAFFNQVKYNCSWSGWKCILCKANYNGKYSIYWLNAGYIDNVTYIRVHKV